MCLYQQDIICAYPNKISLKNAFDLKSLVSIFSKLNQIKINQADVKLQAYVTLQMPRNLESKVRFYKTYMKMSKYENS